MYTVHNDYNDSQYNSHPLTDKLTVHQQLECTAWQWACIGMQPESSHIKGPHRKQLSRSACIPRPGCVSASAVAHRS